MRHCLCTPLAASVVVPLLAGASIATASTNGLKSGHLPLSAVHTINMPGPNTAALLAEDGKRAEEGLPLRFAVPNSVSMSPASHGTWEPLANGKMMWRLRVVSPGSAHLNFGFNFFELPPTASMTIYNADGTDITRTTTARENPANQELWTRIVHGDDIVIEATVHPKMQPAFEDGVLLTSINEGYRGLGATDTRGYSESCNIDVACSEGDPWQNEIPSVGVYTLQGSLTCTGFMVNNTAQDQRPLFMTADHCGISNGNEGSLVVYWNHENSYCRTPGSGDSGGSGDGSWSQYTNGCNFLDDDSYYDSTLVELNSSPNAAWGVTYAGWSRANSAANGAGIHHPQCAEKRISFPDSTSLDGEYWRVNWSEGRAAPGSSGSPLFDSNHRVIGQLCCGASYCDNDYDDYYGRGIAGAWSGMSAHLDPLGTNPTGIDTLVPGGGGDPSGACCIGTSCSYITEADCGASGGSYLGDYVSCSGNPCDGSDPTGGCCVGADCTVVTQAECSAIGGSYQGDGSTCAGDPCGGGGGCADGEIEDCNGNCCPAEWVGDGYCDDGTYEWNGVAIYLNCDEFDCDGGDCPDCGGGGGECPAGEIEDCNGNCCPDYWVGDGYCDDGSYDWNGVAIYLNCDAFDCDGGDCDPADCGGGGDPTGGCCVGTSCLVVSEADCFSAGGSYLGDGSNCSGDPCGGGGDCEPGWTMDCQGTCFPDYVFEEWVGDTYCDDGSYVPYDYGCDECPPGVPFYANCDEFDCDGGDCDPSQCEGGGGDTGGCCVGTSCSVVSEADCASAGGTYLGDGSTYAGDPCGGGGECPDGEIEDCNGNCCPAEWVGDGYCDDGTYEWNGVAIYLNCDAFDCDGGDCDPSACGGTEPTGACCVGTSCSVTTEADCGGAYLGDDTDCSGDPCGGPDPTGGCCVGTSCSVTTEADCGGDYLGDDTDCSGDPCGGGGGDDVAIAYSVSGIDRLSIDQPNFTIDVFAELPAGWRLDAVAGNSAQQKTIACSTSFYQDGYGGPTSLDVNPEFYELAPDLEWDSRVTIGAIDSSGNPFDENTLNHIGIDWTDFENGGDLSADNGVWFVIPTDAQGVSQSFIADDCSERNGVLIARLTAMEMNAEVLVEALFQGRTDTDEVWQASAGGYITYSGEQDCNLNGVPDACDIANGTSDDANGNGIPDECDSNCSGDVDGDGDTDVDDVLTIINGFGVTYDVDDLLDCIADFGCTG